MENTINFGIDLGTTNSAIAKFVAGEVKVFKNPMDWKETLPSVVGFKKESILVGSKAKEFLEKDPKSVMGSFKRKMGTSESFKIKSINESKTPIDLSALILKELKTFLPPGEVLEAAVITIPASFDTIQSNATKEAGIQSGLKQVVLLQEPIAASLAYANMKKEKDLQDGQWLVYDLGGGTFDVALIRIKDGEMKVIDHEGDNFLGGADFDRLIVEKLLIPQIAKKHTFENLEDDLKSASGKLNGKYYTLLNKAERCKITLSAKSSDEIDIDGFEDEDNDAVDLAITISRTEFNELIKEHIDNTIEMVKRILTKNSLKTSDIQFTLMVGGSTYIPFVRQRVEEVLQIPINCEIDPTTAVAIGAAYYAATKPKELKSKNDKKNTARITIKASYPKTSKEKEELFSAKITGDLTGLFYRITREDKGFDSGMKKLTERISEDLPLVENAYNFFKVSIYDNENNLIETDLEIIGINSGFGISGQPLPEDICLEVDDDDHPGETKLILVFQKNQILPLKRTITRSLNKTVIKGSQEEIIRVNVLEGPHTSLPEANKQIGYFEVTGKNINRDIHKGSDIEVTISISESRDLTVASFLNMADQEFLQTFNPTTRHTTVKLMQMEADKLNGKVDLEIDEAVEREDYETAEALKKLKKDVEALNDSTSKLTQDDVTDAKYQLEDRKRKLAQAIDWATKDKRVALAKSEYLIEKERCINTLDSDGNDHERKLVNDIVSNEATFLTSGNPIKINAKTEELSTIRYIILWRTPDFLTVIFNDLSKSGNRMNDQPQAKILIEAGRVALENQNWDRLGEIDHSLLNLLPKSVQKDVTTKIGF